MCYAYIIETNGLFPVEPWLNNDQVPTKMRETQCELFEKCMSMDDKVAWMHLCTAEENERIDNENMAKL